MLKYLWCVIFGKVPATWVCWQAEWAAATQQSRVRLDKGLTANIFHHDRKLFLWVPDHFHYYLLVVCASVRFVSVIVQVPAGFEGIAPSSRLQRAQCLQICDCCSECWWAPALQQHLARIQARHRPTAACYAALTALPGLYIGGLGPAKNAPELGHKKHLSSSSSSIFICFNPKTECFQSC